MKRQENKLMEKKKKAKLTIMGKREIDNNGKNRKQTIIKKIDHSKKEKEIM